MVSFKAVAWGNAIFRLPMSDLLRTKLSAVRRKSVIVAASSGACLAFAAIVGAVGMEMILDWLWELTFILRAAWLAAALAMLVVLLARDVIWPLFRLPDEDEVALWVEHESPGLRSRLIAAIQLSRAQAIPAGQSVSLVRALVRETEEIARPMDFLGVVKLDRLARLGSMASFVFILGIFGMAWGGTTSVDLFERAMLVPGVEVPRKTHVTMITPNPLVIAVGEDVELRAEASGVIPASGSVVIHYDGGSEPVTLPMPADAANAKQFALKLATVPKPFSYRVILNDGHSADGRVEASTRPSVVSLQIGEIFPGYTHLPPAAHSPGDLRILAGSRLAIRVTANKPVKSTTVGDSPFNRVTLQGKTQSVDVPLSLDGSDGKTLIAKQGDDPDIALPADVQGMSIHLVDADGLQTKDPAVYQIELIPDQPPVVRVTYPDRKEQLSTVRAQLLIGIEASDDFALGKLTLHYRVLPPELAQTMPNQDGSAPETVPLSPVSPPSAVSGEIPLDLHGTPKDFRGRFQFELDKLTPPPLEHGAVEWWLEAEDTNDVTGPGKTATDHYLTRIGTEAEVRSDLFARLGNHMGEIKETAETQKQDNADLGEMIQEKVGAPPAP
jgi:hypothetical protein